MTRQATENGPAGGVCLSVQGVDKSFRVNGHRPQALASVSFEVRRGEILGILGPSGCGKTTLLNIIAGFLPADVGQVLVSGRTINGPGPDRAVVFQEDALFPWLTAAENIAFGLKNLRLSKKERQEKVERFLSLVGLDGYGGYLPRALSGGMKQRVALARVLVLEPELLLMDEPFASLDAQTRWGMHHLLITLQANLSQTVVLVTHDLEEAVKLADRVLVMVKQPGRIQREFSIELPRPRQMDSEAFLDLKREIFACLAPA